MEIGHRIRELRKQKHLTLRQLAEMVEINYTYLSKIENGRLSHTPSVRTLRELAHALDADELELLQLANKLPSGLGRILRNRDALRFFRRASQVGLTDDVWKDLEKYLEQRANR
jgi:transcriptional regulator with XRE-family HTH domain